MSRKSHQPTLEEWKEATWQYLLEHCDITDGGALFVKFHTDSRKSFERRIRARVNGYSRVDSRLNCTTEEKEELHVTLRKQQVTKKKVKHEKWKADAAERRRIFNEVKERNERLLYLSRYPKVVRPLVNRWLLFYATARIRMVQFKQGVSRHRGSATARSSRASEKSS